jgi:tRNA threonylcarbamoyladenosine biosynthesis protein TsaB
MSNHIISDGAESPYEAAPAEALTLALDTATAERSVALLRGERPLVVRARGQREAGASTVLLDVDEALREAAVGLEEIELFAAATGPGSFTGIRAGLATVKALARTLGRRAAGVPTLHALAHAAGPAERLLAFIPAGRGEFFAQLLAVSPAGEVFEHEPPVHIAPEALLRRAKEHGGGLKWACAGGAATFSEQLREAAREAGLQFGQDACAGLAAKDTEWLLCETRGALAPFVGLLARSRRSRAGGDAEEDPLKALYVRPSDAELKV